MSLEKLAYCLEQPTAVIYENLVQLKERYAADAQSALTILETGNLFLLTTKPTQADLLKKYAQSPLAHTLSQAALEILAIIAYKQPIARVQIDEIRGVSSSASLQRLSERRLIEEKGRVDGPGRAILYGTTAYFMDYFGLKSLDELPDIRQMETDFEEELPLDLFFEHENQSFAAPIASEEEK